jgi:predicted dehydrogenase
VTSDTRVIRIAVVGLGKMGLSHLAIVNAHPELEVAAVCDSSGMVRGVLEKYTGVATYDDYGRMLGELDLDAVLARLASN